MQLLSIIRVSVCDQAPAWGCSGPQNCEGEYLVMTLSPPFQPISLAGFTQYLFSNPLNPSLKASGLRTHEFNMGQAENRARQISLIYYLVLLPLFYVNTPTTDTLSIKSQREYLANSPGVKGKKMQL